MACTIKEIAADILSTSTRTVTIHAPAATVWRWLIQTGVGRGGWIFYLRPIDERTTCLIGRYPMHADAIGTFAISEPAHFVMESGMMLGLKQRAEKYPEHWGSHYRMLWRSAKPFSSGSHCPL